MITSNEQLIRHLAELGYLKTPKMAEAFRRVDRRLFVDEDFAERAYEDEPLPIGSGQTISQPLVVAFMLELLDLKEGETVLEIGTGSGWQTVLLASGTCSEFTAQEAQREGICINPHVVSIERVPELRVKAERNIQKTAGIAKGDIVLIEGDGAHGYGKYAPYDKIIAAAASDQIPAAWKDQLKIGGRIVAPSGDSIVVLDKTGRDSFEERSFFGFSFVPLVSG
jgi:protein-L-isoaspartate(D-aspartate) O-methyltransferase